MKVYNTEYELIGNTVNYKIKDTYHTIEDSYLDLEGNLVEGLFSLCIDQHPETNERICIKIEAYKPKLHLCWWKSDE